MKYEVKWSPKEDITAYELAQCIPLLPTRFHEIPEWDELDESLTRHFVVMEFDYDQMIIDNAAKLKEVLGAE
jgi:hypothetical protein